MTTAVAPTPLPSGAVRPPAPPELTEPQLYVQRELSLLEFNRRVLAQAADPGVPLLERLRFLTICNTNLDEFFEIRVAGLKEQLSYASAQTGPDGLAPADALARIGESAHALVADQYRLLNTVLFPELAGERVRVLRRSDWSEPQAAFAHEYFRREVLPVLTPMGLDPAHPFPRVTNKALTFLVTMGGRDAFGREGGYAVVRVPRALPRLVRIGGGGWDFALLSAIIHAHVAELFPGMEVLGCHQFRVTRDSDLWIDDEEVDDLRFALMGELAHRRYGVAVRLEVAETCPAEIREFLLGQFQLGLPDLYVVDGPVNLHRLSELYATIDRPDLKYPPFAPGMSELASGSLDLFDAIKKGDLLLHHPFQSIGPVLELLRQATVDRDVLAIKMCLYRTGETSPVADALIAAARAEKEVTAVIELRARFDEEANIDLANRLQEAGVNVAYGVVGYKTHAKMLLVVRREGPVLRRYVHLGTGNYHLTTARTYTDLGLLTAHEGLAEDVHQVFMQLTGLGRTRPLSYLLESPFTLHEGILRLIEEEAEHARAGRPARIIAKINALNDPRTIQALYRASQAGVQIDLIIRGACALRPGIPGISKTIRVRSIVGRFLEHSRAFYFGGAGQPRVYCASADWMERNFLRRVEVCFPVLDPQLAARVVDECLTTYLEDNQRAWEMQADGSYLPVRSGDDPPRSAQQRLLVKLREKG
jgi:polyphosphate kinase